MLLAVTNYFCYSRCLEHRASGRSRYNVWKLVVCSPSNKARRLTDDAGSGGDAGRRHRRGKRLGTASPAPSFVRPREGRQNEYGTGGTEARAERPDVSQLKAPLPYPATTPAKRAPAARAAHAHARRCARAAPPPAVTSRRRGRQRRAFRRVRRGSSLSNAREPAFRQFLALSLPARPGPPLLADDEGRAAGLGAMVRRTKPEVERYVASVGAAASSPREVSAAGPAAAAGGAPAASPRPLWGPLPARPVPPFLPRLPGQRGGRGLGRRPGWPAGAGGPDAREKRGAGRPGGALRPRSSSTGEGGRGVPLPGAPVGRSLPRGCWSRVGGQLKPRAGAESLPWKRGLPQLRAS